MDIHELEHITGSHDDCFALKNAVDELRHSMRMHDMSLIKGTNICFNFDDLGDIPDGRFAIIYMGVRFDCFFKRNSQSDKLYVIFNGYREAGQEPVFKRWSYYNYIDGNLLNIDDPMCRIHSDIGLGWYYGTEEESYCNYIVDIINKLGLHYNFESITFFASSGGGYAALYCACKINGSMAIAINPQIKLDLYKYTKRFQEITGLNLSVNDKFRRNHLPEMIKDADKTKFIIIENSASNVDMVQLDYLCSILESKFHYGLTQLKPNILSWVYEGSIELPHNAQEYFGMFWAIKYLAEHFDESEKISDIFLIFSELWNDHYELVNECQKAFKEKKRKIVHLSSLSSATVSEVIYRKVFTKTEIIIPAQNNPYNFTVICGELDSNSTYKFIVNAVEILSGKTDVFSVIIKDKLTGSIDLLKNFKITDKEMSIWFSTGADTSEKELRVYSGEACKTNNISVKVCSCQLFKIEYIYST